jgi:hypothetical protein
VLAEHHVDQRTQAIDVTIEITPLRVDLDVGLVDTPATACFAASASPEAFGQPRRELDFPVANCLVTEHDTPDKEHLRQITKPSFKRQSTTRAMTSLG